MSHTFIHRFGAPILAALAGIIPALFVISAEYAPEIRKAVVAVAQKTGRVAKVVFVKAPVAAVKLGEAFARSHPNITKVKLRAAKSEIAFFVSLTAMRQLHKITIRGQPLVPDPDEPFRRGKKAIREVAIDIRDQALEDQGDLATVGLILGTASLVIAVGMLTGAGIGGTVPVLGILLELLLAEG